MAKLKIIYFFFSLLLILSCKQKNEFVTEDYVITNRNFNFQNQSINIFKQQVKIINKNDYKLFMYNNSKTGVDSLKIYSNSKVYYRGILLKKIDSKFIKMNGLSVYLEKFFLEDEKNYQGDCYLFISNQNGIVFRELLNSGTMTEYDIRKFNKIHEAIALKQLGFRKGKFELEFARMDYPNLKY